MKLLYTRTSPYARKILVLAAERGLTVAGQTVDPMANDPALISASPIGKVPVLQLDDGQILQDSRVICSYLESLAGRAPDSWAEQSKEALAEAILDAALTVVMERRRVASEQSPAAIDRHCVRIQRIVDSFEASPLPKVDGAMNRTQIGLAVALGYLDFRLPDLGWSDRCAALSGWHAEIVSRPSMMSTMP